MSSTLESLNSLVMIFIMIIPGILLSKKNILTVDQSDGVNKIVTNVTWPCLVIDAMQIPFSTQMLQDCGVTFMILVVIFVVAFFLSKVMIRLMHIQKEQGYIVTFMLIFANTGFIGLPVINALYGKEAVFYGSVVEMVNDIFLFTVGIMLIQMSANAGRRMELKSLISPGFIGVVIGFLLFLFDVTLPGFLGRSVELIGNATTPLSMLVIGMQIGRIPFKELVGDYRMYVFSVLKLLVIPGIVFGVMVLLFGDASMLSKVVIMEVAMPAASCTVIFSQQYKGDVAFATKGVLLSTVLSIATLPIFTILLAQF